MEPAKDQLADCCLCALLSPRLHRLVRPLHVKDSIERQRYYRRMEATTNLTAKTKVPKEIPVRFCARALFRKISIR